MRFSHQDKPASSGIRRNLVPTLLASAIAAALPVSAYAEDAAVAEEVVVTGIRSSLQKAADLKKNDSRIVDAIVAEDIGKLPDNNIAEALQRVTGVSIETDFGVGDSVSIRGLPQNRVELNGRTTSGDTRDGMSLQDFPSSFLSSVEVIKSPTADMIEGALGGTVRMNTVRPLELQGLTLAGSADYEYSDKTEEWGPILNGSVGNVWDLDSGGTFGVVGNISFQDRTLRQDNYFARWEMFDLESELGFASNGPGGNFQVANQHTVEQYEEERERTAVNVSFQWAPASEDGNVYLDINMTDRSGSQRGNSIIDNGELRDRSGNLRLDGATQDQYGVLSGYEQQTWAIPKAYLEFRNTKALSNALGFEFNFSDSFTVAGEISQSSSESTTPDSHFNLRGVNQANVDAHVATLSPGDNSGWFDASDPITDVSFRDPVEAGGAGLRNWYDQTFTLNGDGVPSVVTVDSVITDPWTNPANLALRQYEYQLRQTDNEEIAARLDFEWAEAFGLEYVSALKAGFRFTENDFKLTESEFDTGSNLYKDTFDDVTGLPASVFADDFLALFPGTFTEFDHPNSFSQHGIGESSMLNYLIYDDLDNPEATFERVMTALEGTNNYRAGTLAENMSPSQGLYREIAESTGAFYLSAEFDFDVITAVVGGRYVTTDVESSTFVDGDLVTGTNDYADFLPSMNATYHVNDSTMVRFAAAKVMRRPDYTDLSSAFEPNGNLTTAERGALGLDPFRATQYDLSVEYYFDTGMVSAALFYKDVESFFKDEITCVATPITIANQNTAEWPTVCLLNQAGVTNTDIVFHQEQVVGNGENEVIALRDAGLTGIRTSEKSNGESGTVEGFELAYQQHFDFLPGLWSGLGVSANYTYADSEQPNGNPLLDISKNSYNVQVYWEGESFQTRLAYNFRDQYLDTEGEKRIQTIGADGAGFDNAPGEDPTEGNNYRDDRGQLDFSASWDVNDSITLVGNVTNLLEEPVSFVTEIGNTWKWTEADRRFSLGIRAKF